MLSPCLSFQHIQHATLHNLAHCCPFLVYSVKSTALEVRRSGTTSSNSTSSLSPSIGSGAPSKDVRIQYDSNSLDLVDSQTSPDIYCLREVCGGLYNLRTHRAAPSCISACK
ncbi:hypothetical protein F4804DRAFT_301156 [Jackrogersella minutella]|nr:hypothetical protein F4804DRAFT_301156 [Jackrogersella minutella]